MLLYEICGYNKVNAHFFFLQDLFLYRDMLLIFLLCVFLSMYSLMSCCFCLCVWTFNTYIQRAFIVKDWGQTGSSNT